MERFIDRQEELDTLEREYASASASFVVLYGRRRVGKTALLTSFLRRHEDSVYFLATEESEEQNLSSFRKVVADYTGNELLGASTADWQTVFRQLSGYRSKSRKVIVMDEFQYLGSSNVAFPSVMQRIWDTELKNCDIMLILCGSLISLMKSQTLDYGSPLYGRRTAQIRLKQIPFRYYGDFFEGRKTEELLPYYAVTGGVPKYIEMFSEEGDFYSAVEKSILNTRSFLYEEPYFLLDREVSEIGSYFSLIRAIAWGNRKLSAICAYLGVKQSSLTKYLKVLADLDLIEREVPVTESVPEKSKLGLYRLKDNYMAFWFRFVYPYRSYLERGERDYVLQQIRNGFIQNYASFVYEDICRERVWEMSAKGTWPFVFARVGRQWGGQIGEIDIVGIDSENKGILIGECKYSQSEKGLPVLHELEEKGKALAKSLGCSDVYYVIFSAGGFTRGLQDAVNDHLTLAR